MKKIIFGLSGIVLVAFIVVMVANASAGDPKDVKKATTEMTKDCSKCPTAASCAEKTAASTKTSDAKPCAAAAKACCPGSTDAKKCDESKPCDSSKK